MTVRAVAIPRSRSCCAVQRDTYRCVLDITRVVESWDPVRKIWTPEIRLCHLHAIEYVTGEKVFLPTFAQQEIAMRELGA